MRYGFGQGYVDLLHVDARLIIDVLRRLPLKQF
jgi:hypothetical protein